MKMKRAIQFGALAAFVIMLAGTVKADPVIYSYTLMGPSTDVTFDVAEFPANDPSQPVPFPGTEGSGFFVTPTNLVINGSGSSDVVEFFNSSNGGGLEDNPPLATDTPAFNLVGPQLYTGDEAGTDPTNPLQMSLGMFTLFSCEDLACDTVGTTPYTLSVAEVSTPEPATLLLFGTGLMGLILMRKRFAVN
jgi:hypothetical protein